MNEVRIFSSTEFGDIRTAGTPEEPMFCLGDVCKVLDLTVKGVTQRLDKGVISTYPLKTAGGTQEAYFVTEDGLYDVILDSRKPEAKAFRKWVTSEVLPSIRRTGGYLGATQSDSPEEIMAKALLLADRTMKDQKQRIRMLEGETEIQREKIERLEPKAQYTDEVLQSQSTYTFTEMAKALNLRSVRVFIDCLVDKGVLFKKGGKMKMLTAKYSGLGYTEVRTARFFHRDGTPDTCTSTVWTEAGRMFLYALKQRGYFD